MEHARCSWRPPEEWSEWSEWLAAGLHARHRWRLPVLLLGILFASGRRTVSTWLRAAGISDDYQDYYYFLASVGRKASSVATRLLILLLRHLPVGPRLLAVLDDSPTKRYGPKVEGASIHRNPTPGPADQKYLYGHIWVTISLAVRHPLWGPLGLPLRAMLYVRQKVLTSIPSRRNWRFATKLELAVKLIRWMAPIVQEAGKTLWLVVDGSYAKRPLLRACGKPGVVVVGRLRRDAALRTVPKDTRSRKPRGRPRKYGQAKISPAKRAGQKRGWQKVDCLAYGRLVTKTVKTFLATWKPAGGLIRVVIIKEEHGWLALFCTDINASVVDIVQAYADRATIEQCYHDAKEVWGTGQQQVRNIWTNVAVYHMNLWMHSLLELWGWNRPHGELCDRSQSPWDNPDRRPSHADRRKSLQRLVIRNEFSALPGFARLPHTIRVFVNRLMDLAA